MNTEETEQLRKLERSLKTAVSVNDVLQLVGRATLMLPKEKSEQFQKEATDRMRAFKWAKQNIKEFVGTCLDGEPGMHEASSKSMDLLIQIFLLGYDAGKQEKSK